MAQEIERKFLTVSMDFVHQSTAHRISQGYICSDAHRVVRVRIYDNQAFLTIKNASVGFARNEFEYTIPVSDARFMLEEICQQPIIEKIRYVMPCGDFFWEIDVFEGDNQGLIVAEIELPDVATEFEKPTFIGTEVTNDERYYNANLFKNPYKLWK